MPKPKPSSDRRVQKTRLALMSAFVELLLTRGYEVLTAAQISRHANVGRSTFYLHYANKEELLAESLKNHSTRLAACVGGNVTPQQLVPLLDHYREQRSANRAFFGDPIRSLWVRSLAGLIESRLNAQVDGRRPALPRPLVGLMIAEMQIALITHWLAHRFALKSEVIAASLLASTQAMLSALGRPGPPGS
jgi:AcrR family transcriptional regulator